MSEFEVSAKGLFTEKAFHATAVWYEETSGEADILSQEAQLTLTRTSSVIMASLHERRISFGRFNVQRTLYRAEGRRLLMSDLGQRLSVSPTNVTKVVDSLVDENLVRRVADSEDRRRVWAELTDEGVKAFEETLSLVVGYTNAIWRGITSLEKQLLIHVLCKVRMNMMSVTDDDLEALFDIVDEEPDGIAIGELHSGSLT